MAINLKTRAFENIADLRDVTIIHDCNPASDNKACSTLLSPGFFVALGDECLVCLIGNCF